MRTFPSIRIAAGNVVAAGIAATGVCLLAAALAPAQTARPNPSAKRPQVLLSGQVHKNLQLLKNIPEDQFMDTMGFFSAALGEGCEFCHGPDSIGNWDKFADETPMKQTARKMIRMVDDINKRHFAGQRALTCYSCHRGGQQPQRIPSLDGIYDPPPSLQPDVITRGPASPAPDEILNKYLQALGGPQQLTAIATLVAKGTVQEFGELEKHPVEIYARAPAQLATIVTLPTGVSTTVCDGNAAWIAAPYEERPVPLLPLTGGELEGATLDAQLTFPAQIKQLLTGWRVGFPYEIAGRDTQVVQGFTAAHSAVRLYFDTQSGLLVRQVRYTNTAVGALPTQVDYSDYREVAKIKIPFHVITTWADGRTVTELSEVQWNVAIDAAKFAEPAPSPSAKTAGR